MKINELARLFLTHDKEKWRWTVWVICIGEAYIESSGSHNVLLFQYQFIALLGCCFKQKKTRWVLVVFGC
jgi:hypothetical protein